MDGVSQQVADDKIRTVIEDYIEKFMEKNAISSDEDFGVELYPIGESSTLNMISYNGEVIASVLHHGEEVIITSYFRERDIELFN